MIWELNTAEYLLSDYQILIMFNRSNLFAISPHFKVPEFLNLHWFCCSQGTRGLQGQFEPHQFGPSLKIPVG